RDKAAVARQIREGGGGGGDAGEAAGAQPAQAEGKIAREDPPRPHRTAPRRMKVGSVGEFGLIERIRKAAPQGRGVRAGIGDDAAWLECRGRALLVTADLLIEGFHFDLRWTSFYALGYKTLAVNLSDIAAMGGIPDYL